MYSYILLVIIDERGGGINSVRTHLIKHLYICVMYISPAGRQCLNQQQLACNLKCSLSHFLLKKTEAHSALHTKIPSKLSSCHEQVVSAWITF